MTLNQTNGTKRRKAVWGPKRLLIAGALVLAGLPGTAAAARGTSSGPSRHNRPAPKATPGEPSNRVRNYRVDDEVTKRAKGNPLLTSRVIVTLTPGRSCRRSSRSTRAASIWI